MTRDIDLCRFDDEFSTSADLEEAVNSDLGEYFYYTVKRTPNLERLKGIKAVRYNVECVLANRLFERFPVDVGLGEKQPISSETLEFPDLLSFADISSPKVPAISIEQQLAEKIHAYSGTYGIHANRPSTRTKDLIDIVLVSELAIINASQFNKVLDQTYTFRDCHPRPNALPKPPQDWSNPYTRMATEVGVSKSIRAGYLQAEMFINPILARTASGNWNPLARAWE
jgi:hypothetical protein